MGTPTKYAFVDLETTGGSAQHDRITEIAIIRVEGESVTRYQSLINPQQHISRACTLFCVSYLRHRWPRKRSSKCIVNQFIANLQF